MYNNHQDRFASVETTCGLLLLELQKIWDEVGENEVPRDQMLFQIEQECLEVYKRKVDRANEFRSELQTQVALAESEIEDIRSTLGEISVKDEQKATGNLKEKSQSINPLLKEMRKRKAERENQFLEIINEIKSISKEIFGPTKENLLEINEMVLVGTDLSLKRLEELQKRLLELKTEKANRLKQVFGLVDILNSLCLVLGMDFKHHVHKIHPTLDDTKVGVDITDDTIAGLTTTIQSLRDAKIERMKRLRDLGTVLLELWDLIETPIEEQLMFENVTSNLNASESEITEPNMLSMVFINHVEDEVIRLKQLKLSKVKELVLKKKLELKEICRSAHMVTEELSAPEYSDEAVSYGDKDPVHVLEEIELDVAKVKEEARSRKEILDKLDKWSAAYEEENWLEEYNRDDNRYNAGRGTHLTLKRAEKARAVINKIPAMVETLTSKIIAWERERGIQFLYDGERLLSRLEQYNNLRKEKEQDKIRQRDQKKLQVQLIAEQEVLFGAKPSPSQSGRKGRRTSVAVASDRKLSVGGAMLQNFNAEKVSVRINPRKKGDYLNQNSLLGCQQYSGFASQASGRRSSEVAGHSVKQQHSAKTRQSESRLIREPLSPIPLTMSSKANIANIPEDQKRMQDEKSQASVPSIKNLMGTPTKSISCKDDENRTPKAFTGPVPTTPTPLAPMIMALTPSTPYLSSSTKTPKSILDQIEYSFEEVRAGFIFRDSQL